MSIGTKRNLWAGTPWPLHPLTSKPEKLHPTSWRLTKMKMSIEPILGRIGWLPKPQINEHRSSTTVDLCVVIEWPDHHCDADLIHLTLMKLSLILQWLFLPVFVIVSTGLVSSHLTFKGRCGVTYFYASHFSINLIPDSGAYLLSVAAFIFIKRGKVEALLQQYLLLLD